MAKAIDKTKPAKGRQPKAGKGEHPPLLAKK
jgi:hypothetical protein